LNRRLGLGNALALDRVDPKGEETRKSFDGGQEANIGLHEGNIAGKIENGVAREVMRLELEKI
jgi:hypothetical protein